MDLDDEDHPTPDGFSGRVWSDIISGIVTSRALGCTGCVVISDNPNGQEKFRATREGTTARYVVTEED